MKAVQRAISIQGEQQRRNAPLAAARSVAKLAPPSTEAWLR